MRVCELTPNPFIEGTPKRLRLLCTPHVKRYGSMYLTNKARNGNTADA